MVSANTPEATHTHAHTESRAEQESSRLEIIDAHVVACEVEHGVQQRARMAVGQHESITPHLLPLSHLSPPGPTNLPLSGGDFFRIGEYPFGIGWVMAEELRPEDVRHGCHADRGARMPTVGSLRLIGAGLSCQQEEKGGKGFREGTDHHLRTRMVLMAR